MSLTSYRAAPPRAKFSLPAAGGICEWVLCALVSCTLATKPGGALLFHRLSDSTIGAVRFHGRVRDGIGWVTDAMATKLCGQHVGSGCEIDAVLYGRLPCLGELPVSRPGRDPLGPALSLMVGLFVQARI